MHDRACTSSGVCCSDASPSCAMGVAQRYEITGAAAWVCHRVHDIQLGRHPRSASAFQIARHAHLLKVLLGTDSQKL